MESVHGPPPEGVLVVWFASNLRGLFLIPVVFGYLILFPCNAMQEHITCTRAYMDCTTIFSIVQISYFGW